MSSPLRIPPINKCALSSTYDEESKCATITLQHWYRQNLIQVSERLPANYTNMGYHARKHTMQNVVRKVQVELGRRMQELASCQELEPIATTIS